LNVTKIVEFDKGMWEIWGVWCKKVQFSTMSELTQIRILSLKALIATSLPLKSKKSFIALISAPIRFSIIQIKLKMGKI
jgi:hypothetical protein